MKKIALKFMFLCLLSTVFTNESNAQKKYHYIKAQNGQYLTVESGDYSNGGRVVLANFSGDNTQKWELAANFDRNGQNESMFLMTCSQPRKALDIYANGTANGTPISLWDFHGGFNQKWQFEIIDGNVSGVFRAYIQSIAGQRSMDFCNANKNMYLWEFNRTDCQKWTFEPCPPPQCVSPLKDESFELQNAGQASAPWVIEGVGGIDINKNLASKGKNNAWIRNTKDWNGVRQSLKLNANTPYTLTISVRTSPNMHNGYVGFRDANQKMVSEVKIDQQAQYNQITVKFTPSVSGMYNIFAGFWATEGDTWMQIDDCKLNFPCN